MNIQNAYNEWSGIYDSNQNLTRDLDAQVTRATLAGKRFQSILELGCGTGKNTIFLAEIGERLHAFDFSVGMIQEAKQKVRSNNVRFENADLTQRWHCDDSAYDLIACNLVLEHIEDLSHIFSEAARTLMPGGVFLINELHPFKQYGGTKARFERGADVVEVDIFVHHISEFVNTAQSCGLTLLKFNEYWYAEDAGKPPRLVSFLFGKIS
jgi:ubiquinone/menaquinone biosynthesis C-methylase UbiE